MGIHKSIRIDSLDQWRGWAMIFVLINHGLKPTGSVEGLGRAGVNLFFVISGILTAFSLLSLQRKNQNIWLELPRKRIWRLVPTLWVFVVLVVVFDRIIGRDTSFDLLSTFLFYSNYTPQDHTSLTHLWSLSCEMHFYLASPLLFWLGVRSGGVGKVALFLLAGGLVAVGAIQAGISSGLMEPVVFGEGFYGKVTTQVGVWPMIVGFMWGLYNPAKRIKWEGLKKWIPVLVVVTHALLIGILFAQSRILTVLIGLALVPLMLGCYEAGVVAPGKIGRGLVWLGRRTYSIYLVQQLFTLAAPYDSRYWPIGALVAIPAGGLFYYLVESRFVKK